MKPGLNAATVTSRVRDLPALPAALREILGALRDQDMRTDRFAALIERDQALCARTLRLANSAFYGLQGRVGSVHDALQLLGLRTVGNMMTAAALAAHADLSRCAGFEFRSYWRHSVAVSIAAREIAQACGNDSDQACVTGLLHDAGKLALAAYFPAELSAALELSHSADLEPVEAERTVLCMDHAEVGGIVAQHWFLPPALVFAIRHHHAPPALAAGCAPAGAWLVDTVHLADAMVHALNIAKDPRESVSGISLDSWERLGAARLDTSRVFAAVESGVASMAAALQL